MILKKMFQKRKNVAEKIKINTYQKLLLLFNIKILNENLKLIIIIYIIY